MTTAPTARVAVVATPFGFGPAAKAYSIGTLLAAEYDFDVRYYGSASALDFFAAQGLNARELSNGNTDFASGCDAVVNVLAPELIMSTAIAARTHYVDSLGFMWQDADVPTESMLRQVRGYYAQDLFGSAANLSRLGIPGVVPVSGIVTDSTVSPHRCPGRGSRRALVNLGGLGNPAGTRSARAYLPLVKRLITELQRGPYELTVAMNRSIDGLTLDTDVPVEHHSSEAFQAAVTACDVVFSSPGMTTLVEVSRAERPYVPLPPQNWSQVVITGHLARQSGQEVWSFLTEHYSAIDEHDEEMRKAAAVREINNRLAANGKFAAKYGSLALHAAEAAEVPTVGAPFEGAHDVAAAVAVDLGASGGPPRK